MGNSGSSGSKPDRGRRAPPPTTTQSNRGGKKSLQGEDDDAATEAESEDSLDDLDDDDRHAPPVPHARIQQASWYQKAKLAYDQLVNAIIRPPRSKYDASELGPTQFSFCNKVFRRKDLVLKNIRGQRIFVSHWEPFDIDRRSLELPFVVYMHGNSSCRKEAISQLSLVLSLGATLCTLDFSGSGKSDGHFVSLGVHEKDDLACVIQHLRDSGTVGKIALWGRSMGAATALLHGPRDSKLAAMVCDSPFSSLVALAEGMVEMGRKHGIYAPGFLVSLAIRFIRSSVLEHANFDVYDLAPAEEAHKSIVPLLLIAAEGDAFIPPAHSQIIFHNYGGPKHALVVPGDHNSVRPKGCLDLVAIFLANALQIKDADVLPDGLHFVGRPPWAQQEVLDYERSLGTYSRSPIKHGAENDIGTGMDRAQQDATKDKVFNLLQGGSR